MCSSDLCTEVLGVYLSDTSKARLLRSNGTYSKVRAGRNGLAISAQEHLLRVAATADGAQRVRASQPSGAVEMTPGMTASDNHPVDSSSADGVTSDV